MTALSRAYSPNKLMVLAIPVLLALLAFVVFVGLMLLRPNVTPQTSPPLNWLPDDGEIPISLLPGVQSRTYAFHGRPSQPTLLTLQTTVSTFAFAAQIKDDKGDTVAHFDQPLQVAALALAPSTGSFQLTVQATEKDSAGTVVVAIGAAAAARSTAGCGGSRPRSDQRPRPEPGRRTRRA